MMRRASVAVCALSVTRRFHASASAAGGAVVRHPAPAFSAQALLPNGTFGTLKLSDYKGRWLVLASYPLDFTFVCPTEIIAFSDRHDEFAAIGTDVVLWSVDSVFSHLAWTHVPKTKGGLGKMKIPMIGDVTKEMSKAYGALIEGAGDGDAGATLRGTYIIDPKGILRVASLHDLPVGRSVDEVLRVVQAFQYHEKNGDVCPEGWKPGAKTMKADPLASMEYFSQLK